MGPLDGTSYLAGRKLPSTMWGRCSLEEALTRPDPGCSPDLCPPTCRALGNQLLLFVIHPGCGFCSCGQAGTHQALGLQLLPFGLCSAAGVSSVSLARWHRCVVQWAGRRSPQ